MRTTTPKNAITIPPDAKRVFKGIIYDVYHWQQQMFDGSHETFERLKRPDTVRIIAVKDGKTVVQKQQQPDGPEFYDIPGGRHDEEDETEVEAAQRELLEETGMRFKTWRLLEVVQPGRKIDWLVYTFLATDFEGEQAPQLDSGEKITTELLPFDEAKQRLASAKGRHFPGVMKRVDSLEDLLQLPSYKESQ